jgi:uncharacterized membrane-anchored protein YhcB (DUF1043 family)
MKRKEEMNKQQLLDYLQLIQKYLEQSEEILLKIYYSYKNKNEKVADWAGQLSTLMAQDKNLISNFMDYVSREMTESES